MSQCQMFVQDGFVLYVCMSPKVFITRSQFRSWFRPYGATKVSSFIIQSFSLCFSLSFNVSADGVLMVLRSANSVGGVGTVRSLVAWVEWVPWWHGYHRSMGDMGQILALVA